MPLKKIHQRNINNLRRKVYDSYIDNVSLPCLIIDSAYIIIQSSYLEQSSCGTFWRGTFDRIIEIKENIDNVRVVR